MSTVTFTTPRLRLAALLRKSGGPAAADAIAEAQANLRTLAPESRDELARQLAAADNAFDRLGQDDDAALADIYMAAVNAIGLGELSGEGALDVALTSLCDLVDDLRSQGQCDAEAVAVHLQAWRLLLTTEVTADASRRMMDGLIKVSARFALP